MQVHDAQGMVLGGYGEDVDAAVAPPDQQLVGIAHQCVATSGAQKASMTGPCPLLQEDALQAIAISAGVAGTVLDKCHQQVPAVLREVAEAMHDMLLVSSSPRSAYRHAVGAKSWV